MDFDSGASHHMTPLSHILNLAYNIITTFSNMIKRQFNAHVKRNHP